MHKDIKDIIEYRESTSDCYREEGFKFFNDHILEFVSDESIPVLERINFANIVLNNYIEHFGRMQNMNLPWVHFKMINEFQKITGKINTAFSTIDTSILTHFHINMPKIYNEPEDEKDKEVLLVNQNCDIGYIKKNFGWAVLIWGILFALSGYVEHGQYGYFSILGIFMESASAILILRFAWSICRYDWIVQLGKYSFAIYLVHINIVPIVNKFLGGNAFGEIASPVCTYIISFLLIWCACMLLKKMKMSHLTKYLLGVRME